MRCCLQHYLSLVRLITPRPYKNTSNINITIHKYTTFSRYGNFSLFVGHATTFVWNISTATGWMPWIVIQICMVPRGWILLTLVVAWLPQCHLEVDICSSEWNNSTAVELITMQFVSHIHSLCELFLTFHRTLSSRWYIDLFNLAVWFTTSTKASQSS